MKSRLPIFLLLTLLAAVTQARHKTANCIDTTKTWSSQKENHNTDEAILVSDGYDLSTVQFLVLDI